MASMDLNENFDIRDRYNSVVEPLLPPQPLKKLDNKDERWTSVRKYFADLCPFLPLLYWLPSHSSKWKENLRGDILAGLSVGFVLIPQGIAFALIANLPPAYGLYAGFVPAVSYALWGTCGQMSVGPAATVALLTGQACGRYYDPFMEIEEHAALANVMAFQVGAIIILFGMLGLGFVTNFVSHGVIEGYKTGLFFSVGIGQVKYVLGTPIAGGEFFDSLVDMFKQIPHSNPNAIYYSIVTAAFIIGFKKWSQSNWPGSSQIRYIPGIVVVVILGILINYLAPSDVDLVGPIVPGLPKPALVKLTDPNFFGVLPDSFIIAIIVFVETYALAITFSIKHHYDINATREFYGPGFANLIGSFFLSLPVAGTPSRTVISDLAGSKTQGYNFVVGFVLVIGLLVLTPLFETLPQAILGTVVILALAGLVQPSHWMQIYHVKRLDILVPLVTFIVILIMGVAEGIGVGVAVSIVLLVYYQAFPDYNILSLKKGYDRKYTGIYKYDDEKSPPGMAIFRFEASLHFANFPIFKQQLLDTVNRRRKGPNPVKVVILDFSNIHFVDSTAASGLKELNKALLSPSPSSLAKPVKMRIAAAQTPVRRVLQCSGFLHDPTQIDIAKSRNEGDDKNQFFESVYDAVKRYEIISFDLEKDTISPLPTSSCVDDVDPSSIALRTYSTGHQFLSSEMCHMCIENVCTHVVIPCGHACMCQDCAVRMNSLKISNPQEEQTCPQCNGNAQMVMKFYTN